MEKRRPLFGDWKPFCRYLLSHPKNIKIHKFMLDSSEENPTMTATTTTTSTSNTAAVIVDKESYITWELLLSMMRNTVSHELYFNWTGLQEMVSSALDFFKTRENIESTIKLYEKVLIQTKGLDPSVVGSGMLPLYPGNDRIYLPIWDDLLLFSQLIPCRALNSIVDATFEDEMDKFAMERRFGNWDAFVMYLKTHPANPEQMQANLSNISWLTVIRLARNIICHERNWNWTGLQEMKSHFLQYFKSLENIHLFFETYKRKCRGYLDQVSHSKKPSSVKPGSLLAKFHPVAPIQIECKDALVVSPYTGDIFIFLGYLVVERYTMNWINKPNGMYTYICIRSNWTLFQSYQFNSNCNEDFNFLKSNQYG